MTDVGNPNVPNGFVPIKTRDGSPYNGKYREYIHLATDGVAIYVGDLVKFTGTGDANGKPVVAQAAAGDFVCGVCVGVKPDVFTDLPYCAVSTLRTINVADDPDLIFEVQEDSAGGDIAVASIGLNANVVVGSGSTVTGISGSMLDSSDVATDTTGTLKIMRLSSRPKNAVGQYAKWEVMIAEHQFAQATAEIGTDI